MKRNEVKELMVKPHAELSDALKESRARLQTLKFDLQAGKVKNVAELRRVKKDIARILTALNKK